MTYSEHPKIIILGIDGLDYLLVKKWQLKNIMQKTYCKMDLSDYKIIVTPPIWGSMLTGKIDYEIMKTWEKTAKIVGFKRGIEQNRLAKLGIKLTPFLTSRVGKGLLKILENMSKNPFEATANYINVKKEKNIFQFFEKPWNNGVPGYGRVDSNPLKRQLHLQAIGGEEKPFVNYIIKDYKNDKTQLLSALNKQEHDLIFWYTSITDSLGHIYISRPLTLMQYYLEINEIVGKVKDKYPSSIIYIISDHGMERVGLGRWGMHSNYAFFSSSTGEIISKPYELYDLVLKHKNI